MVTFFSRYWSSIVSTVLDISGEGEKTLRDTFFYFQNFSIFLEFFKKAKKYFSNEKAAAKIDPGIGVYARKHV